MSTKEEDDLYGECRFNPPNQENSHFPQVSLDEWCGQFQETKMHDLLEFSDKERKLVLVAITRMPDSGEYRQLHDRIKSVWRK